MRGVFIFRGRLNRKSRVVLGEEALNKVFSYKTIRANTTESEFAFLSENPLE
jgi:hypothetical protein